MPKKNLYGDKCRKLSYKDESFHFFLPSFSNYLFYFQYLAGVLVFLLNYYK